MRLFIEALGLIVPIEIVWVLIVVGLIVVGAGSWYMKYRRDQKWIKEFQERNPGRRQRSTQAREDDC